MLQEICRILLKLEFTNGWLDFRKNIFSNLMTELIIRIDRQQ
jgi:hypothetical protein